MKKATKIWIIAAIVLIIAGIMIFGGVMTMLKWDFSKLSTIEYVKNSYELEEEIKSISVITNTADVTFAPSDDDSTRVECYEKSNAKHTVAVEDGTLMIELCDERKWFEHIGINTDTPKITVTLPKGEYGTLSIKNNTGDATVPDGFSFDTVDINSSTGDVSLLSGAKGDIKINLSTGDILIKSISAKKLDLTVSTGRIKAEDIDLIENMSVKVSTGKVNLKRVSCKAFDSTGDTGKITLQNVIANEKLSVERSTGDITLEGCDSENITVTTDTGDVCGTLLSKKIFITKTSTGDVDVPTSTEGGRCEITTSTGDIDIDIEY